MFFLLNKQEIIIVISMYDTIYLRNEKYIKMAISIFLVNNNSTIKIYKLIHVRYISLFICITFY